MRHLIFIWPVLFLPFTAAAAEKSPAPIRALLQYCLPALERDEDPADLAVRQGLLEFPLEQVLKFMPQGGGRVFAIPFAEGEAVLMTNGSHKSMCNIAVLKTKAAELLSALDRWSGTETRFRLIREKRFDSERVTRREYGANISGPVTFIVSVSDVPRKNGMQALMTLARPDTPLRKK